MPPTRRSATPPSPFAPWHPEHCDTNTSPPCFTVPLPSGKPTPSGVTSMFQPAISRAVGVRPRLYVCACANDDTMQVATRMLRSSVDIGQLPTASNLPALDGVVVVLRRVAALRDELRTRGLDVTRAVHCATLQDRLAAVPHPWQPKANSRAVEDGLLQLRFPPISPAVDRDIHPPDLSHAAPSKPRDLVEALILEPKSWRRMGDRGLGFHGERKWSRAAVRHRAGVLGRLLAGHERRVPDLEPP